MYAITRAKKALNAWYWRVTFSRCGKSYFRTFYDLKHGSSKNALAAAIAWRDRQLATVKVLTYREICAYRRSNYRSGVAGVHFLKTRRQPRGAWQAKIKLPDGRKITKSFAVMKFGRREAFKLAAAARERMLKLVGERPYLYDITAKKFAARSAAKKISRGRAST